MRSGSTLLRLTLDKLPNVVGLPETYFFEFAAQTVCDWQEPRARQQVAESWVNYFTIQRFPIDHASLQARIAAEAASWRDLLGLTVAAYTAYKYGDTSPAELTWCEKSPPHIFYEQHILSMYPQARLLYLVRDPRAVIASLKSCHWSTANIVTNAKVWCNGVRQMREDDQRLIVRYEDLVEAPMDTLRHIAAFLGTSVPGDLLEQETHDAVEQRKAKSQASLEQISTRHRDKWKELLSVPDREGQIVERLCQEEMKRFGYEEVYMQESRDLRYHVSYATKYAAYLTEALLKRTGLMQ